MYDKIHSLRTHGQGKDRYSYDRVGINGRFDALQAAVIIEKLGIFAEEIQARQRIADFYNEALGNDVITPLIQGDRTSVFAQYTIRVREDERAQLQSDLQKKGVPSVIYYPKPIHLQPAYQKFPSVEMSNTLKLCDTVLSLPMHPYLEQVSQEIIIDAVRESVAASCEV